jgi:hypothetical protein
MIPSGGRRDFKPLRYRASADRAGQPKPFCNDAQTGPQEQGTRKLYLTDGLFDLPSLRKSNQVTFSPSEFKSGFVSSSRTAEFGHKRQQLTSSYHVQFAQDASTSLPEFGEKQRTMKVGGGFQRRVYLGNVCERLAELSP